LRDIPDRLVYIGKSSATSFKPFSDDGCLIFFFGFFSQLDRQPYRFLGTATARKTETVAQLFQASCDRFGFPRTISYRAYYSLRSLGPRHISHPETDTLADVFGLSKLGVIVLEPLSPITVLSPSVSRSRGFQRFYLEDATLPEFSFPDFHRFASRYVSLNLRRPSDLQILEVTVPSQVDENLYTQYFAEVLNLPYSPDSDRMLFFVERYNSPIPEESCRTISNLHAFAVTKRKPVLSVIIRRALGTDSTVPLAVFVSSDGANEIGGFQAEVGMGQTFGDLFEMAVGLTLLSSDVENLVRFVVQDSEGFLENPHSEFSAEVDPGYHWARIEVCPTEQRNMDLDRERLCQIHICKDSYGIITGRKSQRPLFFTLIKGETVQNFRIRLQRKLDAVTKHARIVEGNVVNPKEFVSSDVLWDLFPGENPAVGVILAPDDDHPLTDRSLKIRD
jgi:hypothetical protein